MLLKQYYSKHLRSLYISKFYYIRSSEVLNLTKLVTSFRMGNKNYSLKLLFLLLVTRFWPFAKSFDLKALTGRSKFVLNVFSFSFRKLSAFLFLERMLLVYLSNLDNWGGVVDSFKSSSWIPGVLTVRLKSFFYIFFELDFLCDYTLKTWQEVSNFWVWTLALHSNAKTSNELLTLCRSLYFPVSKRGL